MTVAGVTWTDVLGLGPSGPDELLLTTFSLDEEELFSLATHLGLWGGSSVTVRFDRSGFRGFGEQRIVPPSWLLPVTSVGPPRRGISPPVFHAKVALSIARAQCRVGIGTANLVRAFGTPAANLVCPLSAHWAPGRGPPDWVEAVRDWLRASVPRRTLVVVVGEGGDPETTVTDQSTWGVLEQRRAGYRDDRWLLVAPFWSRAALRRIATGDGARVDALFPDALSAHKVAGPCLSLFAAGHLRCLRPAGTLRFHQKVLAWRGTRQGTARVLLYLGSANLTSAGFFGIGRDASAWNWEAGVLFEGDARLWPHAVSLARHGVSTWATVNVRPGESDPDDPWEDGAPADEDDLESRLRQHLGSVIVVETDAVRMRSGTRWMLHGWALQRTWLVLDGHAHSLRRRVALLARPKEVLVRGLYEGTGFARASDRRVVEVEIPEVCEAPERSGLGPNLEAVRRMLYQGDEDWRDVPPGGNLDGEGSDSAGGRWGNQDVRFPFREFIDRQRRDPAAVERWLAHVHQSGHVPGFWKLLAERLSS